MDYLSAFAKEHGLDPDGERIYGKVSLQEVETGAMVPAGRSYVVFESWKRKRWVSEEEF